MQTIIKVVFNDSYGPPAQLLSPEAICWIKAHGYVGSIYGPTGILIMPRHHPILVACVEALGERANGHDPKHGLAADLRIAEIKGERYYVVNYDGKETVIGEKDMVNVRQTGGVI